MLDTISSFVWGTPTICVILFTGIFLTSKLNFIQLRKFKKAVCLLLKDHTDQNSGIKPKHALMTALSATIGTGNIAGVATAITLGGPGAIFWMWVTAVIGMATKYAEAFFAIKYRTKNSSGVFVGGPMYYISIGLGKKFDWLAKSFAVFGCIAGFGIGNAIQINTIANTAYSNSGIPKLATGIIVALIIGIVLIGGIKRIASFASKIVPFMAILYLSSCVFCIISNIDLAGKAFNLIITSAFSNKAALGFTLGMSIKMGVSRGIFSNEAGLGSAAIAHASSTEKDPERQGLIAMLGVFIDTILICTVSSIVIIMADKSKAHGSVLVEQSLDKLMSHGSEIVSICVILFAFTSIIGWSFYSEKCLEFLFGSKFNKQFKILWVLVIPFAAVFKLYQVWSIADILNAFMIIPNVIGLILLAKKGFCKH